MNSYWWTGVDRWNDTVVSNFGDELAPLILGQFAGINVSWSEPANAQIITVGSVIDVLPQTGWTGVVAGAGKLLATTTTDLTQATVVGLRGPLTLEGLKLKREHRHNLVLGDPALLVPDFVTVQRDATVLGCVPHISDTELYPREVARANRDHYTPPVLIDPSDNPLDVVAAIGGCQKIISSSLHGIVVADAFGIPRRAESFSEMTTNPHQGADFKFRDYSESIGLSVEWGTLQQANHNRIEAMQCDLFDMLRSVQHLCG